MNTFRNERQHVVPRWLTYKESVESGELDKTSKRGVKELVADVSFDEDYKVFEKSRAPLLASDLLGRALLSGDNERASTLAQFLLDNGSSPSITLRIARSVLGIHEKEPTLTKHREQAANLKQRLREFPRNAVGWIDLARIYTILNQDDKAESSIRAALALAPNDRFCVRAAARFYMHVHDEEAAYRLFRKNSDRLKDPWIRATAASTAIWAKKPSLLPKKSELNELVKECTLDFSELIEAYAMEEYNSGGDRIAKKAVRAALIAPSANAVSHAEWFTRTCLPGISDAVKPHVSLSRAARAHELFFQEADVNGALAVTEEWNLEEPYSSAPLIHASYLACVGENYEKVVSIAEEAAERKITNLTLLNNAAFSLIHLDRLAEARELLDLLIARQSGRVHYSVSATDGLYKIKSGLAADGRLAYERAIEDAKSNEIQVVPKVKLHMFLALLQNGKEITANDIEELRLIAKNPKDTAERILILQIARLRDAERVA